MCQPKCVVEKDEIKFIDMTPDDLLPTRILIAYLSSTYSTWETEGLDDSQKKMYDILNQAQLERRDILRSAIDLLHTFPFGVKK